MKKPLKTSDFFAIFLTKIMLISGQNYVIFETCHITKAYKIS